MGHQISVRMADQDVRDLECYLSENAAVFVPRQWPTATVSTQDSLAMTPGTNSYPAILRLADLPKAKRYYVVDQGYWLLDSDTAPTLDWRRGHLIGDPLTAGRLYYRSLKQRAPTTADPTFDAWAAAVLRWIRSRFHYDHASREYIGPYASRARAELG